jgi:hypothetical protein
MNSFERGLHTEFDPAFQPKGSYRDLTNAVRDLSGTLYSENGTIEIMNIPTGLKLVGKILINQTLVLFLSNLQSGSENVSEIGIYENEQYVPYVSNRINSGAKLQLTEDVFRFNEFNLVPGTGRTNYNGDLLIYFSDGNGEARTINLTKVESENPLTFAEDSKLFISRLIPVINYVSVTDDGECLSGVYQFAARYVTNSGNTSPFGFVTNPISIVDESENSNFGQYDGCLPQTQTAKSINIEVSHLDTDYPFIEIAMQTYVGLQNTPTYKIIARLPNNKSVISYKFTGKEDRGSITKDEFIQEGASYSFVSFYQQKNNHLLIAGLAAKNEDFGFEELANNIEIKLQARFTSPSQNRVLFNTSESDDGRFPTYVDSDYINYGNTLITGRGNIIDLKSQSLGGANTYKSPVFAADNKCYMPDEVYSFAFVPIFKDGTYGFAYPILAKSTLPKTEQDFANLLGEDDILETFNPFTGIGTLLRYDSEETYADGNESKIIRHFRFPPKRYYAKFVEDVYKGEDVPNPARHNVVYGIHVSNINFTEAQKKVLQGYVIVRQKRDTFQNKSVLSQGFAKNFSKNNAGNVTVWDIPVLGTTQLENYPPDGGTDSDRLVGINTSTGELLSATIGDYCKFYSPDIFHNVETGQFAKQMCYGGDLKISLGYLAQGGGTSVQQDLFVASLENTNYTNDSAYDQGFSDFIEDRANLGTELEERTIIANLLKNVSADNYYDTNSFWRPSGLDYQSFGDQSKTCLYRLNGRLKKTYNRQTLAGADFNFVKLRRDSSNNVSDFDGNKTKKVKLSTHYIKANNTRQYGKLEEAEYMQVGVSFDLNATSISLMGGDCYLSYYWMNYKELLSFEGFNRSIFTIVQLPILSEQNYNLRHYVEAGSGQTAQDSEGTQPYYPKETRIFNGSTGQRIGLANLDIKNGVSSGYNKQYGFQNITKSFFAKPFLYEKIIDFSNRVAYSDQSIEGEQLDAFRIFKQNNYQDVTRQFGKISDLFVFNDVLYAHCENALFRLSFLEQTALVTTSGEVEVGDGKKLMNSPRIVYDINGGYAGTTTRWANVNTPFGRFFIDTNQKKVFLLSDSIREISDLGMKRLFFENLKHKENSYYNRYIGTYDYQNDRYLLFDTDPSFSFAYSYHPKSESWLSRHTWKPQDLFYFGAKLFSFSGDKMYAHTDNKNTLIIYGNNEEFSITVVENEQIVQTKRYDNVRMYCEFFRNTNSSGIETIIDPKSVLPIHLEEKGLSYKNFFDEVTISNDNHLVNKPFSFDIKDTESVLVRRLNSEYRFAIPRNTNPEKVKQRITGKFAILSIRKNQSAGDSIKLNWIDITSTPYER